MKVEIQIPTNGCISLQTKLCHPDTTRMAPRVLLTVGAIFNYPLNLLDFSKNDDGPPNSKDSPYVLGLYLHLKDQLGIYPSPVIKSTLFFKKNQAGMSRLSFPVHRNRGSVLPFPLLLLHLTLAYRESIPYQGSHKRKILLPQGRWYWRPLTTAKTTERRRTGRYYLTCKQDLFLTQFIG